MQRHQLLVTPPQQAGKRARREIVVERVVVGGIMAGWVGCRVGGDEKVRRSESDGGESGQARAVVSFVYRPF